MPKGKRNVNKIIIHHSASPQSTTREQIYDWHVNGNGWSDIGYHYIVLGNGEVVSGRHVNKTGAHCKKSAKTAKKRKPTTIRSKKMSKETLSTRRS